MLYMDKLPHGQGVRWVFLIALLFQLLVSSVSSFEHVQCDVTANGLDREGREVGAAYVQCLKGTVVWKYPRNGLRVLMRSPVPGHEFRGCISAAPDFGGARILVEGSNTLVPLLDVHNDNLPLEKPRCFSSYEGKVALFLEADILSEGGGGINRNIASFEYDLQILPKGTFYSPLEECRPCTDSELLESYCSADFVASGRVLSVDYHESGARPNQYSYNTFVTPRPDHSMAVGYNGRPYVKDAHINFIARTVYKDPKDAFQRGKGGILTARIGVPPQCEMRAGTDEYLLVGRFKLKSPVLTCIPKLQDFKRIYKSLNNKKARCPIEI